MGPASDRADVDEPDLERDQVRGRRARCVSVARAARRRWIRGQDRGPASPRPSLRASSSASSEPRRRGITAEWTGSLRGAPDRRGAWRLHRCDQPRWRRSLLHRQLADRSFEIRDVRRLLRQCRTWPVAPVGGVTTFATMSLTTTLSHAHLRNHFHACAFVMGPVRSARSSIPSSSKGCSGERRRSTSSIRSTGTSTIGGWGPRRRRPELLEVTTWEHAHLKGGTFDQERMMTALDELIREPRGDRAARHAPRRSDGLGVLVAARDRAAGRLRGERQRGAQPRQDADRLRLRRAAAERLAW